MELEFNEPEDTFIEKGDVFLTWNNNEESKNFMFGEKHKDGLVYLINLDNG